MQQKTEIQVVTGSRQARRVCMPILLKEMASELKILALAFFVARRIQRIKEVVLEKEISKMCTQSAIG
jgi:hypothetical protein